VATLRELVAVGQSDAQILARPAIHAALERATWHHPRADAPSRKRCGLACRLRDRQRREAGGL
jgi:hypothetical protein